MKKKNKEKKYPLQILKRLGRASNKKHIGLKNRGWEI